MATIDWDTGQVRQLAVDLATAGPKVQARAAVVIRRGAYAVEADGKVLAPVDTGFLRSSIGVDFDGDLAAQIGPTADYGVYVELGVPHPWIIRARPGGWLHFVDGGRDVFARQVTHPPMAPRPYMGPAFDRNEPAIRDALSIAASEDVL